MAEAVSVVGVAVRGDVVLGDGFLLRGGLLDGLALDGLALDDADRVAAGDDVLDEAVDLTARDSVGGLDGLALDVAVLGGAVDLTARVSVGEPVGLALDVAVDAEDDAACVGLAVVDDGAVPEVLSEGVADVGLPELELGVLVGAELVEAGGVLDAGGELDGVLVGALDDDDGADGEAVGELDGELPEGELPDGGVADDDPDGGGGELLDDEDDGEVEGVGEDVGEGFSASHFVTGNVALAARSAPTALVAAMLCGAIAVPTTNAPVVESKTPPATRPIDTGRTRAKHM